MNGTSAKVELKDCLSVPHPTQSPDLQPALAPGKIIKPKMAQFLKFKVFSWIQGNSVVLSQSDLKAQKSEKTTMTGEEGEQKALPQGHRHNNDETQPAIHPVSEKESSKCLCRAA